jgi:hypothetical protein
MAENDTDEELKQQRDDIRCDGALQTIEDVLWRFNESCEGTLSVYDLLGFLVEDLIREGFCAACVNEALVAAFARTEADIRQHRSDDGSALTRGPDDVFH